jgi:hypothetical protein
MEITEFLVTAASSIAILTFVVGAFTWYARTWLKTQFEGNVAQLLPKLVNDDTSEARYAHQARDAATEALRRETKTYYVTHTKDGKELAVRDINDC